MAKKDPTTAAELNDLSVAQLEKLATKRNVTVRRSDGDDGAPLKDDYVRALTVAAAGKRPVFQHKYVDAQGRPVNEDGELIDKYGVVIEDEK